MAITITADSILSARMEKIALAGIKHPLLSTHDMVSPPFICRFAVVAGVATLELIEDGTYEWGYAAEPTMTFDDRTLG